MTYSQNNYRHQIRDNTSKFGDNNPVEKKSVLLLKLLTKKASNNTIQT